MMGYDRLRPRHCVGLAQPNTSHGKFCMTVMGVFPHGVVFAGVNRRAQSANALASISHDLSGAESSRRSDEHDEAVESLT